MIKHEINPQLDLVLEKVIDVKPQQVWRYYTEAELLMQWFCPKPWRTVKCEIELIPGGKFTTVMQGPEGQEIASSGCILEVVPNRKLVWTSALLAGYRPRPKPDNEADLFFSAIIYLQPQGNGTKYTAIALHQSESDCNKHRDMGFHEGWGMALEQLVALCR